MTALLESVQHHDKPIANPTVCTIQLPMGTFFIFNSHYVLGIVLIFTLVLYKMF